MHIHPLDTLRSSKRTMDLSLFYCKGLVLLLQGTIRRSLFFHTVIMIEMVFSLLLDKLKKVDPSR